MYSIAAPALCRALACLAVCLVITDCRSRSNAPTPPADFGDASRIARGRALFLEQCVLCHGERADGHGIRREAFDRPPRDFTDSAWRASVDPPTVYRALDHGVAGTAMPSWAVLGDEKLWDLTAYVLSVARPAGQRDYDDFVRSVG